MNKLWTDEYVDAIHVFLQSLNLRLVVALGFLSVKGPEPVSTAVKVTDNVLFFWSWVRLGTTTVDRWTVTNRWPFRLHQIPETISQPQPEGAVYAPRISGSTPGSGRDCVSP